MKKRPAYYTPTDKDVEALLKAVEGTELELPVLLASTGSLRRSEICGLRWESVDLKEQVIHVRNVLTTAGGLELTDPNPVVTLQQNSGSSGDVDFSPAWEE